MIKIDKSEQNPDISVYNDKGLVGPGGKKMTLAERDLARAKAYFGDPTKFKDNKKLTNEKTIEYQAYKHKDTKNELKKVFKNKCAYCESYIAHIESGDIEHFRPKAQVEANDGSTLIPGYYWLGADWNNLLLSCTNCNRPNKQLINGHGDLVLMGKANKFPLTIEDERIRNANKPIVQEDPFSLLLNPCKEDPSTHIQFEPNGRVTALDKMGEESIAVYGLYRADLVLKRGRTNNNLRDLLEVLALEVKDMAEKIEHDLSIETSKKKLRIHLRTLSSAFDESAEYIAMKRQTIKQFIADNGVAHQKLKEYNIDLNRFIPLT